ncbi:folylpolyglutamate synthase [Candidatus Magnetomorum sp. HK-1]|nr:folylpolyglutamate synthase [Candidatus Magnetomorum sp. HK-1]
MNDNELQRSYNSLLNKLESLIGEIKFSAEINLRLERISHLLDLIGNPHCNYPSVHVGGTSGKGSTSTMISHILTNSGYKTGLHLSPHLQILNERHQINNRVTKTTSLIDLFSIIEPLIEKVANKNPFGKPSYFEVQVALAFYLFFRESVDVAVVEVGLGGTLDATNVLNSNVAVITSIGLDHTDILGETIEEITSDKSGIIKNNQFVISGAKQKNARQIISERCQNQKNCGLWQLGKDFKYKIYDNGKFDLYMPTKTYPNLELPIKGKFQIENAACAVAAVENLMDFNVSYENVCEGLLNFNFPGRMEIIQHNPIVILDGSHNPDKMKATSQIISDDYANKRIIAVLSLKSDKSATDILPYVINKAELVILTSFYVKGLWEPMNPESLAELIKDISPNIGIYIIKDPLEAIKQALHDAKSDDLIWVTGSLYLVGDIREYWYPSKRLILKAEDYLSGSLTI